jgi:hypothetical protein
MRITVSYVLGWLTAGMTHEEIISDYPNSPKKTFARVLSTLRIVTAHNQPRSGEMFIANGCFSFILECERDAKHLAHIRKDLNQGGIYKYFVPTARGHEAILLVSGFMSTPLVDSHAESNP